MIEKVGTCLPLRDLRNGEHMVRYPETLGSRYRQAALERQASQASTAEPADSATCPREATSASRARRSKSLCRSIQDLNGLDLAPGRFDNPYHSRATIGALEHPRLLSQARLSTTLTAFPLLRAMDLGSTSRTLTVIPTTLSILSLILRSNRSRALNSPENIFCGTSTCTSRLSRYPSLVITSW